MPHCQAIEGHTRHIILQSECFLAGLAAASRGWIRAEGFSRALLPHLAEGLAAASRPWKLKQATDGSAVRHRLQPLAAASLAAQCLLADCETHLVRLKVQEAAREAIRAAMAAERRSVDALQDALAKGKSVNLPPEELQNGA